MYHDIQFHHYSKQLREAEEDDTYFLMSGALLVTTTEGKLSVFESEYAPCLTAPLAFGCLALKIWGRQAACCLALPEPAASAAVETGIVDQ